MNLNDINGILGFRNSQSLALSSIFYPLEQAKIQISLNPNPTYNLQRIVDQVKQTYHVAGLHGCYTGFIPWFITTITYKSAFHVTLLAFTPSDLKDIDLDGLSEYRRFRLFAHFLGRGIVCRTAGVVASQPFYVVTVRMVAELFARQVKYTDLIWSLWLLLREEGLAGLFAGLFPRLLADLTLYTSIATLTYAIHRGLALDAAARQLVDLMVGNAAGFYCIPLSVVSVRTAASGRLPSGSPYHFHTPHFILEPSLQQIK